MLWSNKKKYCSLFCSSVFDVAAAINESSTINQAEICGLPDGRTLVDVYDFRNTFKPIDYLLSFHRYEIFSETPGVVVCRKYVDSDPIQNMVLKKDGFLGFPEKLSPKGLSYDRMKYLYTQIRQHCKQGSEDLVAPNPDKQLKNYENISNGLQFVLTSRLGNWVDSEVEGTYFLLLVVLFFFVSCMTFFVFSPGELGW